MRAHETHRTSRLPFGQVLHQASDLCEHRRRGLRHASTTMTAPNNGSTSTSAGRRSIQPNSLLRCSFLAAAAMVAILPSPAGARDTFTVSTGYQHSCIVTADASVKVRGNAQELRGVYFLALSSGAALACVVASLTNSFFSGSGSARRKTCLREQGTRVPGI